MTLQTIANKKKRAIFSSSSSDSEEVGVNGRSVAGEQRRTQLEQLLNRRKGLNHLAGNYTSSDGNRRRTRNSLSRAAAAAEITVGSGSEGYLDKEEDDGKSDDDTDNKATLVDSMDMRRSSSRRRTRHSSGSSSLKAVPGAIPNRHLKKADVIFGLEQDDESIVDVKRSSSFKKASTSRIFSLETEDAEASDDAVIVSSKKIPIPITEFTESEESEQDHAQNREIRKANLLRLQRKVTGEPSTSSEEENDEEEKEEEEEEFDSDDAQLSIPKASSTPRGRVLRSMGTEVEILSLPSDSATTSDASSDSQEIVKKKKRHKRKSRSSSKRTSLIMDEESDVLESNLEDMVNTEDEWEDSTAGTHLYCSICEEFFGKDNFSMDQQKYGGDDRFCLLHTWAGGRVRAEDYNEELDARVNRSKRLLKSMEDRYQLNEKTLGESDYESDGFIVKELDE